MANFDSLKHLGLYTLAMWALALVLSVFALGIGLFMTLMFAAFSMDSPGPWTVRALLTVLQPLLIAGMFAFIAVMSAVLWQLGVARIAAAAVLLSEAAFIIAQFSVKGGLVRLHP